MYPALSVMLIRIRCSPSQKSRCNTLGLIVWVYTDADAEERASIGPVDPRHHAKHVPIRDSLQLLQGRLTREDGEVWVVDLRIQ